MDAKKNSKKVGTLGECGGASLDMLHSSEIRALCPTKYSREIIQKLCFFFILLILVSPYECSGLEK